ncbi:MAG: hypothetical protein HY906_24800 [Deltaproteobacteria bacterium]|nr:hypothetical protein [Deltaproteobacteria bacterium]
MRPSSALCLCTAAVLLTGCKTKYYYVDSGVPIGHACPTGDECYGGSFCVEGKCTIKCQTNAECWSGTECRPYGETNDLTCVTVRYIKGAALGGTPCGVDPTACNVVDPQCDPQYHCGQSCASDDECSPSYRCSPDFNQCVRQLFCYGRQTDDPDSFCTQECTDDRDCPAKLYCESVATEADRNRKICVPRKFCAPCVFDSDCDVMGGVCVGDQWGVKFCTTPCTPPVEPPARIDCDPGKDVDSDIDCRAAVDGRDYVCRASPEGGWWMCKDPNLYNCPQPYSECKDAGDGRNLCYHRYGACKGDGSLCSPCRSRKDCDEASGALCYRNQYTQERFCTSTCTGAGTCPDASYVCFEFNSECTKDASCYAPDGKCDTNTGTCTPENPPQCLKDFDPQNMSNASYPTCYPSQAGYCCD